MNKSEIIEKFPFMGTEKFEPKTLDLGSRLFNILCHASGIELENQFQVVEFLKDKTSKDLIGYGVDGHDLLRLREWTLSRVSEKLT